MGGRAVELALFGVVFLIAILAGWQVHGRDTDAFLWHYSDNLGYYQWLPGSIINHDIDRMFWQYQLPSGKYLSIFTFGVALMQLPFFLLGHVWALAFGHPTTGFSTPYAVTILASSVTYSALGCVMAFRLARRFAAWPYALAAATLLFLGTNLLYYSAHEANMSHSYSFFLMGLFAWSTLRVLSGPQKMAAVLWVASLGMLVFVRQLNVIALLFPALLALRDPGGMRGFMRNLLAHRTAFFLSAALSAIPYFLMVAYWIRITGSPFVFSYGVKGEHFEWDRMVPLAVLASVRNGWLVYSPIMIPVITWLIITAWKGLRSARAILVMVLLTCLIYSAWWSWHLGTSYGHRGFIDLYALLAIPLAGLLRWLWHRGRTVRIASATALFLLIWLNLGLTERYTWHWSQDDWTWGQLGGQVEDVFALRYRPVGER